MSRVVERGDLFFFYRPRVGTTAVDELVDVQRFFFVLRPEGAHLYRRLVVGRKRLPDPRAHEREWAFVAEVASRPDDIRDDLERKAYETKTRGVRVQPEARPAGEARYAIVDHGGHTHLAYVLELPPEPGPAQRTFGIREQASYVVAVRNPDAPAPPGVGLPRRRRPDFPPDIDALFGQRRFIAVVTPALLDYEGAEVVLIGAAEDVRRELGVELDAEDERVETAEMFEQLRLAPGDLPIEPLVRGELR